MAERKKYLDAKIPFTDSEMRILGTPVELDNKTIKLDLTRKMRGKGLTVTLQLWNNEGALLGVPKKLELVKSYIRRMMRKRVDYVEDSFEAKCEDINARVKPFLITRKRVSRAVRKNLRNTTREFILGYLKEKTFYEGAQDILNGTLQKAMLPRLKKIYPLSFCEIRVYETKEIRNIDLDTMMKSEGERGERGEISSEEKEEKIEEVQEKEKESEVSKEEKEKPEKEEKEEKKEDD